MTKADLANSSICLLRASSRCSHSSKLASLDLHKTQKVNCNQTWEGQLTDPMNVEST
jgi:hypothetical protein